MVSRSIAAIYCLDDSRFLFHSHHLQWFRGVHEGSVERQRLLGCIYWNTVSLYFDITVVANDLIRLQHLWYLVCLLEVCKADQDPFPLRHGPHVGTS